MTCVICGCTESTPCPGGCAWLTYDPPVCTDCIYEAAEAGLITQADIDRWEEVMEGEIDGWPPVQLGPRADPDSDDEDEPLIVPATEYQAQRFIEDLRKARGAT